MTLEAWLGSQGGADSRTVNLGRVKSYPNGQWGKKPVGDAGITQGGAGRGRGATRIHTHHLHVTAPSRHTLFI